VKPRVNFDKLEEGGTQLEDVASATVRATAPYAFQGEIPLGDEWLFGRLTATASVVKNALDECRFHEATQTVYHFFWGDFCDWYIEWIKADLQSEDKERALVSWKNLFAAFDLALRLLHPFMPFISEELWHQLPQQPGDKSIALKEYPSEKAYIPSSARVNEFADVQEIVGHIRNIRAEMKLDPKKRVVAEIYPSFQDIRDQIERSSAGIIRLGLLTELKIETRGFRDDGGVIRSTSRYDIRVPYVAETIDVAAERVRLRKEMEGLEKAIASKERQLGSETFRSKAPGKIVKQMEEALAAQRIELEKLGERLKQLGT
jgi:valyl-tRNA synthetase